MSSAPGGASVGRPSAVVVVDDDADHAMIIGHVLAELAPQLAVTTVDEVGSADGWLSATPAGALVLIDRLLNGQDSIASLSTLRARRPDLRLVVLSAALSDGDRERALAAGAMLAAEKPAGLANWRTLLGGLLDPGGASR